MKVKIDTQYLLIENKAKDVFLYLCKKNKDLDIQRKAMEKAKEYLSGK